MGEGRRGWGTGETFWRWWVSGETLDEEISITLSLVAAGMSYSFFPSVISVHFNSVQFNLTLSQTSPTPPTTIYWDKYL